MHRNSKHKYPSMLNEECKMIIMAFSGPKKKISVRYVHHRSAVKITVLDYEAFNSMITGSSLVTKSQECAYIRVL